MTRPPWFVVFALLSAALVAQTQPTAPDPRPDLGAPAALPATAPPHLAGIDRGGLRDHAYWLADDARAGRHTTSQGQLATVRYITELFQKAGLKPLGDKKTFLQHYPLRRTWLDQSTSLQFTGHKLDRDLAVLPAGPADKLSLAGRFVFCGNGSKERVPDGLAGRIPLVVLPRGGARGIGGDLQAVQRYQDIAQQLAGAGATAGVVCLLDDQGSLGNTLNYRALLPDHAQLRYGGGNRDLVMKIPLLVLSAAQSQKLFAHTGMPLDQDGAPTGPPANDKASGKLTVVVKSDDKAQGTNVVAVLEGTTRKQEAVVFSAHHDHVGRRLDGDVFNGADDNASGTAALLEIATAFAQAGQRPERSIVFLSVSGEELGLWGSDWYASHPTWPLGQIVADINIDMIGRPGTADQGTQMQITPSHAHGKYSSLVRDAVALGKEFGITFTSGDQYYERSDHFHFAKNGVPVVFFCDGEHPDYHQVSDTADRLDYVRMEAIARLAAWSGWALANAKARPQELGKQPSW